MAPRSGRPSRRASASLAGVTCGFVSLLVLLACLMLFGVAAASLLDLWL